MQRLLDASGETLIRRSPKMTLLMKQNLSHAVQTDMSSKSGFTEG